MITILLAACNGEEYLPAQIESIMSQTFTDFNLIIRDDFSTDRTAQICLHYAAIYPSRISFQQRETASGSAKQNFMELMTAARDDYLMLADQDDFWFPDKIEICLRRMKDIERQHGKTRPALVYTDVKVADNQLNILHESFEKFTESDFENVSLNRLIVQNTVQGCTVMYNAALADLLMEIPACIVMHDWWLALIATCFGYIKYIPKATMLYRQHKNNELGAVNVVSLRYKINRAMNPASVRKAIQGTYAQAGCLLNVFKCRLNPDQVQFLKSYCSIPGLGKFGRWRMVIRLKTFKHGCARNIAYFLLI